MSGLPRRQFLLSAGGALWGAPPAGSPAVVALVKGEERRGMVREALELVDDQIRPRLRGKKYVLLKPN